MIRFLFLVLLLAVPCFAAGTEVPAVAAPLIPPEVLASLVTLLVSAFLSGIAAGFNTFLRRQKKRGKRAGPAVLAVGAAINTVAFNFDQVGRQAKAAKGGTP